MVPIVHSNPGFAEKINSGPKNLVSKLLDKKTMSGEIFLSGPQSMRISEG